MHEMSLCEGLLSILEEQAQSEGFKRVLRVRLEVGPFSGVEQAALCFSFDAVTRDTLAEHAALEIIAVPGRAFCFDCLASVEIQQRFDPCPACGGGRVQTTGGDELRIKEIEVI